MSIAVNIDEGFEFAVKAPVKDVYALLADVPASALLFPKVDRLLALGDGVYRWEMEKIGVPQASLQTMYASRYVMDRKKGSVVWTPVKGVGNAQIGGSWKLAEQWYSTSNGSANGTALALKIKGALDLPLPSAMTTLVVPLVQSEFAGQVEKYIDNLIHRFGGRV